MRIPSVLSGEFKPLKKRMQAILIAIFCLLPVTLPSAAQAESRILTLDQTQGDLFEGTEAQQNWAIDGRQGEMLRIQVWRVAGQFTPSLRLIDARNQQVAVSSSPFPDTAIITLDSGLPADGLYQLEVLRGSVEATGPANPDEYSLLMTRSGQRRSNPDEGLTPLPAPMLSPVISGDLLVTSSLGFLAPERTLIERPDSSVPNRQVLNLDEYEVVINNGFPLSRGVRSITRSETGLAFTLAHNQLAQGEARFFSDQDIQQASYNSSNQLYTFVLANGQTIVSDFYRIDSIQALDGLIEVRMILQDEAGQPLERRLIFDAASLELRRRAGLSASQEPINEIRMGPDAFINTDLEGWETLAVLNNELRVYYGPDARFLSDNLRVDSLLRDNADRSIHRVRLASGTSSQTDFELDWRGMGDLRVQGGVISVMPLDGRVITEVLERVSQVLIEQRAMRFTRTDNTFRVSLPDLTEIETPLPQTLDPQALPWELTYIPRGANNLGAPEIVSCVCEEASADAGPVNPANGNFYYAVEDFNVPSHTLGLQFVRHYNSLGRSVTPEYLRNSPAGYPMGLLGSGWRHSYQIELDLTQAPRGSVTLVEDSGRRHLFMVAADNPALFTSRSRPGQTLERLGGQLGTWVLTDTLGIRHHFDRAGRLDRISETSARSISFAPVPAQYLDADRQNGRFIVDPYGRRLELFTGEDGQIGLLRDPALRQIRYQYGSNGRLLGGVEYIAPSQQATYLYDNRGLLSGVDDVRSPYHPQIRIEYDSLDRVLSVTENPSGTMPRMVSWTYDPASFTAQQTRRVNGLDQLRTWSYILDSQDGLLLNSRSLPRAGYSYAYSYSNGLLADVRQPTLTRFSYQFDARGNLVRLRDPQLAGDAAYTFDIEQRGPFSLITAINYPDGSRERFVYSEGASVEDPPRMLLHSELIEGGREPRSRETRFEYDDRGRLLLRVEPGGAGPRATRYHYDEFGYVSEIWQGIDWQEGESSADLADARSRARRTWRFEYDILGQLRAVTDSRGSVFTLNWDNTSNLLREISGPQGALLRYAYDEVGRIIQVDDRGQITNYDYDELGHVAAITNANSIVTTYTHDEAGNLLQQVDDIGRITRYEYDEMDMLLRSISPGGLVTRYSNFIEEAPSSRLQQREERPDGRVIVRRFDASGRIVQISTRVDNISQVYNIDYNSVGLPTTIRKESGRTLTVEYDLLGRVIALGIVDQRLRFTYDDADHLTSVTRPDGQVIRYEYDLLGGLAAVEYPDGSRENYEMNEVGDLLAYTDPLGEVTRYTYDALNQLIATEDAEGRSTNYSYDVRGNLQTIIDPLGISRTFAYDALDKLLTATDGSGQSTRYSYDALGRLAVIDYQTEGRDATFTYDTEGNISSVNEYRDSRRTLYNYDAGGRVTSVTDALGHTTTYRYNALGQISRIIDPIGNEERYVWNGNTLSLSRFTNPAGLTLSYDNIDPLGRLLTIQDSSSPFDQAQALRFSYDVSGYINQMQQILVNATDVTQGVTERFEYDILGQPTAYIDAAGQRWELVYDARGQLLSAREPNGSETRYEYNRVGEIVRVISQAGTPAEAIETYDYDDNGNIIRYTDPLGVITDYRYDANNRVIEIVEAVGTVSARRQVFQYNGLGELVRYEDPLANETVYRYSRGNLAQMRRQLDESTVVATFYEYDLANNLTSIRLPQLGDDPLLINLTYDALRHRVRYVNSSDNVWAYNYDLLGNVTQISDPLGSGVGYEYDVYQRLTRILYPAGAVVDLQYDSRNMLRSVTLPPANDSSGPRQTINFVVDPLGRLLETRSGDRAGTRYIYDEGGRLVQRISADGLSTSYEYDAAGRLLRSSTPGNSDQIYSYDVAGNLLRLVSSQIQDFSYDVHGRIQSSSQGDTEISYQYNAVDKVTRRDAGDAGETRYSYDAFYRPVRIQQDEHSVELTYNNLGLVSELLRNNGLRTVFRYNANGEPLSILHFGPQNERLDGYNYEYDSVGNIIRIDRVISGRNVGSTLYSYDVAHRLIDERWVNERGEAVYTLNLRYDAAGNRVDEIRNGVRTRYIYNEHNELIGEIRNFTGQETDVLWLPVGVMMLGVFMGGPRRMRRSVAGMIVLLLSGVVMAAPLAQRSPSPEPTLSYVYDAAGRLLQLNGLTEASEPTSLQYVYDSEGRLLRIEGRNPQGDFIDTRLSYDVFSRLIGWQNGRTLGYEMVYDDRDVIARRDTRLDGGIERYMDLPGFGRLATIHEDGSVRWHLNDQFGTTRRFADEDGEILRSGDSAYEFSAFGERIFPYGQPENGITSDLVAYRNGHLYDPASGLYIMGLRAYDPRVGRFIQPDPVLLDPIGTPYSFARNRPLIFDDPSGMINVADLYLRAAAIGDLPARLRPNELVQHPQHPPIPQLPSVASRQMADSLRPLQILDLTRNGLNDVVLQVSPLRDVLYLYQIRPLPDAIRALDARPLHDMIGLLTSGPGWRPDVAPDPSRPRDPFANVRDAELLLAYAQAPTRMQWRNPATAWRPILPDLPQPDGIPYALTQAEALRQSLGRIGLVPALGSTLDDVRENFEAPVSPGLPVPLVQVPQVMSEPPLLLALDDLRQQQREFLRRIYDQGIFDCMECDQPLRFGP